MAFDIRPVHLGRISGNCFILRTSAGFMLVDTGRASKFARLERELGIAGCRPGSLGLVVLTHGDFDHSGNCARIREKYGVRIAMHEGDVGMVERGDMFWNREKGGLLLRKTVNVLFRIRKFSPDLILEEGDDLSRFGVDARVLHLPGHSKGSIGILTSDGDLFCGDLFPNTRRPELNPIMDDLVAAEASVRKLGAYDIRTVYPGHGRPFAMSSLA